MSEKVVSSTGAPQGAIFSLYISDFQFNSESCNFQKCSDDSAVVVWISDGREAEFRELVDHFVEPIVLF